MEEITNAVLIQGATMADIEAMINRAVDRRMEAFYKKIQKKESVLVSRKRAAALLRISLPTLDAYARAGLLRARRIGGRVFFDEEEVMSYTRR